MSEVVNGNDVYVSKIRGTATSFIRVAVVNAVDVAGFDADETAGASVAGTQTVDFDGTVVGGNASGLANDATEYTASITIDGTAYAVAITGSAAQTFTDVITAINADLPGTEAAISGGNIVVTSTTTGNASYVEIVDGDLFSSLTGFAGVLDPVEGGLIGQLKARTLDNGANAWDAYKTAQEVYDTAGVRELVGADYTPADLNATYSDTEVEGELASIAAKINALSTKV